MREQSFFLPNLFHTKGDFNPLDFKESIAGTKFVESIKNGVLNGFSKAKSMHSDWDSSLTLFGQTLHECVLYCISQECYKNMGNNAPTFIPSPEGNQKSFFLFGNYVYIVAKGDVKKQHTRPNNVIYEQSGEKHIITISYLLDETRENIVSIKLEYRKGKSAIFSYPIPLSSIEDMSTTAIEPQVKKPKFKAGIVKKKNETV